MRDFTHYFPVVFLFGLIAWGCEADAPLALDDGVASELAGDEAPVFNDEIIRIVSGPENFVVDAVGNEVTDPDALLFYRNPFVLNDPIQPLLAPDGHQVTLAEYMAVSGRARVKCIEDGTRISVHLSDLFAKGVYTIWLVTFDANGLSGAGALGPADGSGNAFRASASGEGQLSVTATAGDLSLFGTVNDDCLFDDPSIVQWLLVGAYHTDGMTHGGDPGPRAEPFAFVFTN